MTSISKPLNTEKLSDSDSDEGDFRNVALNFWSKHTPEEPITDSAVTSNEFTAFAGLPENGIPKPENLKRSLSAGAKLYEANPKEFICGNHLGEDENLKSSIEEREAHTSENKELSRLPESALSGSLLRRMWGFSTSKKGTEEDLPKYGNRFDITKMQTEIKALKRKNIDYEAQIQEKEREIFKLQDKIITQKQYLQQNFSKKTEIQKEILEEMDLYCKNIEGKLTVERKLRERRETEISHIQDYINTKEIYLRNQTDVRINRIEAAHRQEINTMNKIIKHKDEELSQVNQNYNLLLGRYNKDVEAVDNFRKRSLDKVCTLEEIKSSSLEQSLQLKTQLLREAYVEISNLQRELNNKHHELENVLSKFYKNHNQNVVKGQLENMRQQINEILIGFEEQSSSDTPETRSNNFSSSNVSQEFRKQVGDKEEAD